MLHEAFTVFVKLIIASLILTMNNWWEH